ncbi:MAG: DNA polymerase IV [Ancalomicrobiaceae bacterium]|nr:DNA polymerase IV [Ancalomicrobiaceae bacterium]
MEAGVERLAAFCRDCLWTAPERPENAAGPRPAATRCPACGSPRLIGHTEMNELSIAHIDCDAFYASVEKRDDPSLRDKPVIIGGTSRRGVVSTACYVARIYGVRSAMPMFKALELCPDAVVIPPEMAKYARVGRQVRRLMLELTPLVEPISIDEAFLDLSGTAMLHRSIPAVTLARLAIRIERELGITVSIGLAANKYLAKIASDLDKPRGYAVIGATEAKTFLADKSVALIWGVGKALQSHLARDGISRIGQLQTMDETDLIRRYGTMGQRLARLSRGEDRRSVSPDREAKSVSAEITFFDDVDDPTRLDRSLRALAEKVSRRLKAAGLGGHTIVLKLKTPDFKTITRNRRLADPTKLADRIFRAGHELLRKEIDGRRFRLIGIGVSDLVEADGCDPPDLVDEGAVKRAKAEAAMDRLRQKFGTDAVNVGMLFGTGAKPRRDK